MGLIWVALCFAGPLQMLSRFIMSINETLNDILAGRKKNIGSILQMTVEVLGAGGGGNHFPMFKLQKSLE